jgi:ATP/maltotriose-dependent transcriptional regulator MalT/DNA-binding SARP family transcriptional activator
MNFPGSSDAPLPAKLSRPGLHGVHPRSRLFDLLSRCHGRTAVWVCGPAGSGKTTLVNSYLSHHEVPCIWYELDEEDTDVATFFYHLALAASPFLAEGTAPLPVLTPDCFLNIPAFAKRFFDMLDSKVAHPLALVLDNYQEVREETLLHEVLCIAVDSLVHSVSLFVCSRLEPPPEFARPRANCAIELVGWKHLRLERAETEGVVSCLASLDYDETDVAMLHEKADGWIAGLLLLVRQGEYEDIEPQLLANHTPSEIFDYFGSVLFRRMAIEVQDTLLRLCHLSRITLSTARALAGGDAVTALELLHAENAFTYRSMAQEPVYSFHPLFQEFLQHQAVSLLSAAELAEQQAASAAAMAREGRPDRAVSLYLRAGRVQEAVGLILEQAPQLVAHGRMQTLEEWIDALPAGVAGVIPWLIYWKGVCRMTFEPPLSRPYFERTLEIFRQQDDAFGVYLSFAGIMEAIAISVDDFSELDPWIDTYDALHAKYGEVDDPRVQLRVTSAMLNALVMRRPDHPMMAQWAGRGWELLHAVKQPHLTLHIFMALLTLYIIRGELTRAEDILNIFKQIGRDKANPLPYLITVNLSAFHSWLCGRFEQALAEARRGMELMEQSGITVVYLSLRAHAVCTCIGLGDLKLAQHYYNEGSRLAYRDGHWLQSLHNFVGSWLQLVRGNPAEAMRLADAGLEKALLSKSKPVEPGSYIYYGLAHYENGDREAALVHLEKGLELTERLQILQERFSGLLCRARIALDDGDEELADEMLAQGFGLGRTWNYRYCFFWLPERMTRLCCEALRRGIEVEYVQSLVREHVLLPEAPPLDVANWPWQVRISCLGGFEVTVEGEPLKFTRKAQQRPLSLAKYLLAGGAGVAAVYQMQDALWPEADGDAARNAFKTALYRLRKLLGSEQALVQQDGRLAFEPRLVWTDVQAFQTLCRRIRTEAGSEPAPDRLGEALHELLALYRGPFLPGDDDAWAIPMREKLQSRFMGSLLELGRALEQLGESDTAIACYRRGVEADPLVEAFYERLMTAQARLGRVSEAMRAYEQCRDVLQAELGIEPSSSLEALKKSLLKNRLF